MSPEAPEGAVDRLQIPYEADSMSPTSGHPMLTDSDYPVASSPGKRQSHPTVRDSSQSLAKDPRLRPLDSCEKWTPS